MPDRTIIPLDTARVRAAGALLARAFDTDPTYTMVFPDALKRLEVLTWLLTGVVRHSLRAGTVHTTSELEGVACWMPPGRTNMGVWDTVKAGLLPTPLVLGWPAFMRLGGYLRYSESMHQRFAPDAHYYLFIIGVDPLYQGTGIGTRLMNAGLAMVDTAHRPCYLETGTGSNVRFYTRFGFVLCDQVTVPGTHDTIYAMRREAVRP
ncbi:MAG: GNAT family N-acetyltransferase [Anaerolineae bacterium]